MRKRSTWLAAALISGATILVVPAAAHHGWGSYDAAKPLTITGKIEALVFENPHATITVPHDGKVWTITLAPTSRMISRGATAELVAVGKTVTALGYRSTVQPEEMRAERITVDGKTIELR